MTEPSRPDSMRRMLKDRWFTERDYTPGKELFRTDRHVRIWEQTVSHRQLLLRAIDNDHPTRLDLLFKVVDEQRLHTSYDGLIVRCPTEAEAAELGEGTFFMLESGDIRDHLSAGIFGWQEEELTNFGTDSLLTRNFPLPFTPPWLEADPDFAWYQPSGPAVPLGELVDALSASESPKTETDGFRYVHTVIVQITRTLPGGRETRKVAPVAAYLTRNEAEAAIHAEMAAKAETVARAEKPGATVQDRLVAQTLAETEIDRWVVAVPIRL